MPFDLSAPTSPREVALLLKKNGLHPRKGLGQSFLVDKETAARIVGAAEVHPGDPIIEIGPGLGALTLPLAKSGAEVLALEIDAGLFRVMQEMFRCFSSVKIVHADALQTKWDQLASSCFKGESRVKLISNLPYSISSPLLYQLLEQRFPFSRAVIMLQTEVAQRLVAPPGGKDYSSISVLSQYYTRGKILFKVSRHQFWPRPEVESAVVRLEPRLPLLEISQEKLLWKLVKGVFQVRRKTILNGLLNTFSWKREEALKMLHDSLIDPLRRPETLSVEEFANLCLMIYNKGSR
ncbi:MAG TPA: ribosomal RNA small subunit methyltransferase A, partial [Firmicutes bacterium]|nr:ribosomal RNA small subunit methyltransferase A [Bacillota bacterium]